VKEIEGLEALPDYEAVSFAYQLLAAVNDFIVSSPTLINIFGTPAIEKMSTNFTSTLHILTSARSQNLINKDH